MSSEQPEPGLAQPWPKQLPEGPVGPLYQIIVEHDSSAGWGGAGATAQDPAAQDVVVQGVVVRVMGEADINARDDIAGTIEKLAADGDATVAEIVIDLSETTFLDSEAMSGLLEGKSAAADVGVIVRAVGAQGIVYRVLDVTGLLDFLDHPRRPRR